MWLTQAWQRSVYTSFCCHMVAKYGSLWFLEANEDIEAGRGSELTRLIFVIHMVDSDCSFGGGLLTYRSGLGMEMPYIYLELSLISGSCNQGKQIR